MSRVWGVVATCLALTCTDCHEGIGVGGHSLECNSSDSCAVFGAAWRCYSGVCVENSPPSLAPFEPVVLTIGEPLQVTAVVTDQEGDDVTITWQQSGGPEPLLMSTPVQGATLQLLPQQVGLYQFVAGVEDHISAGQSRELTVMVQPAQAGIYVSEAGADSTACGSMVQPCATITAGLAVARALGEPSQPIYLAAASPTSAYFECLDLSGTAQVVGCFDPVTWQQDPGLIPRCQIECGASVGHHLSDSASLTGLSLSLERGLMPPMNPATAETLPLTCVTLSGGQPTMTDVMVEAPACDAPCTSIGLSAVDSDAALYGLQISSAGSAEVHPERLVGILLHGGAPSLAATPLDRSAIPSRITLPWAPGEHTTGILAVSSEVSLSNLSISMGGAPRTVGIHVVESQTTIEQTTVELRGTALGELRGIVAERCADFAVEASPCDCTQWSSSCPSPASAPPLPIATAISGSRVELRGSPDWSGRPACSAIAVQGSLQGAELSLLDTELSIDDGFPSAIAALLTTAPDSLADQQVSLSGGAIRVGASLADSVCSQLTPAPAGRETLHNSHVGLAIVGPVDANMADLEIQVGAHSDQTIAVAILDGGRIQAAGNSVEVLDHPGQRRAASAIGILITDSTGTAEDPSTLARTDIRMGAGYRESTALKLSGTPYWQVTNSVLQAGHASHATGLSLKPAQLIEQFPFFAHNTIFGGGDPLNGQTSTAVALTLDDGDPLNDASGSDDAGSFGNNLLDAGVAPGRRLLFDNRGPGFFSQRLTNAGQFVGSAAGGGPARILPAPKAQPGASSPDSITADWLVLFARSGELWSVAHAEPNLAPMHGVRVPGPIQAIWTGTVGPTPWVVVAAPDGIALAPVVDKHPIEFVLHPKYDETAPEWQHRPYAVISGYWGNADTPSLAFMEENPVGVHRLWVMNQRDDGTFSSPEPAMDLSSRGVFTTSADRRELIVAAGPVLHLYPSGHEVDLTTRLGESAQVGHLEIISMKDASGPATEDLLLIADNRTRLWLNPNFEDDGSGWSAGVGFGDQPCSAYVFLALQFQASEVTAVTVTDLNLLSPENELAFGCADGRVAMFYLNSGMQRFGFPTDNAGALSNSPVTHISAGRTTSGITLVTAHSGYNRVTAFEALLTPTPRSSLMVEGDVAWRDTEDGEWNSILGGITGDPGIDINAPGALAPCPLIRRQPSTGEDIDLHLDNSSGNACVDTGSDLSLFDDIDGCNARVNMPDIGADEFDSWGETCAP